MQRPLLALALLLAGNAFAWGQSAPPRGTSPFMLPTGDQAEEMNLLGQPGSPAGAPHDPAAMQRAAALPAMDQNRYQAPDAMPAGQSVQSHPLPQPTAPRAVLSLPPPPNSYGAEAGNYAPEQSANYAVEPNSMPPADYVPAEPPTGNNGAAMLDIPAPVEPTPEAEHTHNAYYQQPGNMPQAMEVQPVSGATPALPDMSANAMSVTPLPLAPPSNKDRSLKPTTEVSNSRTALTVAASLSAVIGLFLLVAWGTRKAMPAGLGRIPSEVVEPLGRLPFAGKSELQLIRLGSKLVLMSTANGTMEPVSEVTDPLEVERLLALCRGQKPGSASAVFRETLSQVGAEPARGFAGEFARANPGSSRRS